jgi:hypothetical protein
MALRATDAMAVTDGGAIPELHVGSFGWAMATDDVVLWECDGPVRGMPSQSFRSEGCGRLSLLPFLQRHAELCGIDDPWTLRTGLGNTGVIDREKEHRERCIDLPCCHRAPDADVITQTVDETTQFTQLTFTTEHVKGHQGDDIPHHKLPRMAQLNVLACQLSTDAPQKQLRRSWMGSKIFHPLPSCPVHLQQVNGHTTTSREHRCLKDCMPEAALDQCRRKKFGWTVPMLRSIDWMAHRQARRREADFMLKFAAKCEIEWLPMNSRPHRQKERSNDHCDLCKQRETQAHLPRCPQRSAWRAAFINRLSQHLKRQ